MARERRQPLLSLQTLVAFVALALVSLTAFVAVGRVAADDDRRLLEKRSAEVAALLTAAVRGEAFGDLDATLYASDKASQESQVLTTRVVPIANGYSTTLPIGADQWLLVTAPRGGLNGSLSPAFRWIVLGFGLTVALAISSLVETLARRRRFALRLGDPRTGGFERALEGTARFEEWPMAGRVEGEAAKHGKSQVLSRMSHALRT